MSPARAPFADLDDILLQTRHMLFSFDGTICDLFSGLTATSACDHLRKVITDQGEPPLPADVAGTTDPFEVLKYAADYLGQDMAIRAEAELTKLEDSAATTAVPMPYVDDAVRACRESGRSVTVVSKNRTRAVKLYLSRHEMTRMIGRIVAREVPDMSTVGQARLIERAADELNAEPATCALLCPTVDAIRETETSGVHRIAYVRTAEDRERLAAAGASATITSLADLALRLRARPLPS